MARRETSFIERVEADDSERQALRRFFPKEKIGRVELRLINRGLMTKVCAESRYDPENSDRVDRMVYYGSNLVLLDRNGNQICVVGMEKKSPSNRFWKWLVPNEEEYRCFPECIEEALVRLGNHEVKKVIFALELDGETLILHQPKKGLTLLEWVEALKENRA